MDKIVAAVDESISFSDLSVYATKNTWYFGDGNSSILKNPKHAYSEAGTYTVRLVVTGDGGIDSCSKTVRITKPATIFFVSNESSITLSDFATLYYDDHNEEGLEVIDHGTLFKGEKTGSYKTLYLLRDYFFTMDNLACINPQPVRLEESKENPIVIYDNTEVYCIDKSELSTMEENNIFYNKELTGLKSKELKISDYQPLYTWKKNK